MLFLDLDRFKVINDTLGHRIGDLLLQETAQRLRASLRSTDVMARLGGDEFAVIARYVKTKAALDDLAHCLIKAIREPFELGGYRVRTTISIGIAVSPTDGESADDLIVAADLALYAAKERNRDGYQFYDSAMSKELTDRRQIEVDLREAIEHNELELRYQPIVSLHDGKVTGFEALARWNHRTKGFIPPSDFIPVAEDTGMMARLGEWALSEACGKLAQLPDHLSLAVNLSPVQFTAPDLVESVQRALVASGLAPHRLELEITERLLLENNEEIISVLRRLRQLGVRIALDDFGTGYSALSYLRKFPLDKIKIDRSFVTDIATQKRSGRHHPGGAQHRPRARHDGDGRGRGNGDSEGFPHGAGLRQRAGLSVRQTGSVRRHRRDCRPAGSKECHGGVKRALSPCAGIGGRRTLRHCARPRPSGTFMTAGVPSRDGLRDRAGTIPTRRRCPSRQGG